MKKKINWKQSVVAPQIKKFMSVPFLLIFLYCKKSEKQNEILNSDLYFS